MASTGAGPAQVPSRAFQLFKGEERWGSSDEKEGRLTLGQLPDFILTCLKAEIKWVSQYGTEVRNHGGQTCPGCDTECGTEMASGQWEGLSKAASEPRLTWAERGLLEESRLKLGMETWCPERLCYLGIGIPDACWSGLRQPNVEESLVVSFKGGHRCVFNMSSIHQAFIFMEMSS